MRILQNDRFRFWLIRITAALLPVALLVGVDQALFALFPHQSELGYIHRWPGEPPLYGFERGKEKRYGNLSVRKPANTIRIFVFGGSSTWGLPYGNGGSYSGWLAQLIDLFQPTKRIEIINTGYPSTPTATVRDLAEAALRYEPDIFIVLSGNNEYLLENQVLREASVDSKWLHALRRQLRYKSFFFHTLDRWYSRTRAKTIYRPEAATFSNNAKEVGERYRMEVRAILKMARRHQIKLIFCTDVCNLRDFPPMMSVWEQGVNAYGQLEKMRHAIARENVAQAELEYSALCNLSPGYAQATYEMAQMYLSQGMEFNAELAFRRAKEEDRTLVRMKALFNAIVKKEMPFWGPNNLRLLDAEALFAAASPQHIPGSSLLIDGMHPTLEGHFLLATALLHQLEMGQWVPFKLPIPGLLRFNEYKHFNSRFSPEAILESSGYFINLGRPERARELLLQLKMERDSWQIHIQLARIASEAHQTKEACRELRAAFQMTNGNREVLSGSIDPYPTLKEDWNHCELGR